MKINKNWNWNEWKDLIITKTAKAYNKITKSESTINVKTDKKFI